MKKIGILILLLTLLTALLLACGGQKEAENTAPSTTEFVFPTSGTAAGICPPLMMIDGELYWVEFVKYRFSVQEEDIVGYVTSYISISNSPTENNQSNCLPVGTPYALYEHEELGLIYVAQYKDGWIILTLYEKFLNSH